MTQYRMKNLDRLQDISPVNRGNCNYLLWRYQLSAVIDTLKKIATGRLLDIGCGNKPFEKYLTPLVDEYIGCDVVQSSLNKVDILCEATSIPLDDKSFDTIMSTQVMEHVSDTCSYLLEANRLLKDNGVLIITVPFIWPLHEEPYDFYRFTSHGLKYRLNQAGFKNVTVISTGGLWVSLGMMFVSYTIRDNQSTNTLVRLFWKMYNKLVLLISNSIFPFLNNIFPCKKIPSNYLVIANK